MWFFMILSYILIFISGLGLNIIGFNHYLDLKLFNIGMIKLDLFISMIFSIYFKTFQAFIKP